MPTPRHKARNPRLYGLMTSAEKGKLMAAVTRIRLSQGNFRSSKEAAKFHANQLKAHLENLGVVHQLKKTPQHHYTFSIKLPQPSLPQGWIAKIRKKLSECPTHLIDSKIAKKTKPKSTSPAYLIKIKPK